jgi:hypothetical protein
MPPWLSEPLYVLVMTSGMFGNFTSPPVSEEACRLMFEVTTAYIDTRSKNIETDLKAKYQDSELDNALEKLWNSKVKCVKYSKKIKV